MGVNAGVQLAQVWTASEKIGYPFGTFTKLLILTGQRRNEIAGLRRDWLTVDQFEIPKDSYKTGIDHTVPLAEMASGEIASLPLWKQGPFCFSTTNRSKPISGFSKAKHRLDMLLEIESWTFHDIRRSVATHMASLGISQEHIERVLGHKIAGVAGTYNRYSYNDQKRVALEKWEAHLAMHLPELVQ